MECSLDYISLILCQCFDTSAAFEIVMCWKLTMVAVFHFTRYQLSFLLAKVITALSWGNESDPDTDLILQSRPWHLNRPPGKEPINKEDKRGKSCERCTLVWKGFKSSAGTTENGTWSVASDRCSLCLLVWHVVPCQKGFNNHGHSFISVLHI